MEIYHFNSKTFAPLQVYYSISLIFSIGNFYIVDFPGRYNAGTNKWDAKKHRVYSITL